MTPRELSDKFVAILPGFDHYRNSAANLFGRDSFCGVFAAASHFVREQFESFRPEALDRLGSLLEECLGVSATKLANDCGACFLENLTFEDLTPKLVAHLGARGRESIRALQSEEV